MLYFLISTFSCSASACALGVGRTLKPITTASDAAASVISLSMIAPADARITFSLISFVESFSRTPCNASTDPWTSPFITTLKSIICPSRIFAFKFSRVTLFFPEPSPILSSSCRLVAMLRACFSSSVTWKGSPAEGILLSPIISTGSDGPAFWIFLPLSSNIALTLPA